METLNILVAGGDGYLGWPYSLHMARRGHNVCIADNFSRRHRVAEMGSWSATPIEHLVARVEAAKELKDFEIAYRYGDLCEYEFVEHLFHEINPDVIMHLGEIPSAPYSMISPYHGNETIRNNEVGTLNLLWAMRRICPEAHMVKLGTMGEYGCYDDQTEILTRDGWKLFTDLDPSDHVATRSKEDRTIRFIEPTKYEYDFNGEMYYVRGQRIDLLVTPNHRMFTLGRNDNGYTSLRLEYIPEIIGKNRVYDFGCNWIGVTQEFFVLPKCESRKDTNDIKIPMNVWLEFLGWYLSEGCVPTRKDRPSSYRTELKQKIGPSCEHLKRAISALVEAISVKLSIYEEPNDIQRFTIWDKQLAMYLYPLGKSHTKYIPQDLKQLTPDLLQILLKALIMGDGWVHRPHRGTYRYFSVSKRLADDVQEVALKCGYSANISYSQGKKGYTVNICRTTYTHVNHGTKRDGMVPYKGKVYCVNVGGDGIVLVRRNGKPVWCGNTPDVSIPEGYFDLEIEGRVQKDWPFPRRPGSIYHATKVNDSTQLDMLTRFWDLQATDIHQGVVHGITTKEIDDARLYTRFDFDECFGTSLNRFCAMAVIGHPLRPYGGGGQTRGYIALRDSIQCLRIVSETPPKESGHLRVLNQFDEVYSVYELAEIVQEVAGHINLEVQIEPIDNPRIEAEDHYYDPKHSKLYVLGFKPEFPIRREVQGTISVIYESEIRERILEKKHLIDPTIKWK